MIALNTTAQQYSSMSFQKFQKTLSGINNSTVVVNFWATWCKPCVAELPSFEKANQLHSGKNFHMILVNLDFNSQADSSVVPFINKKNIRSKVIHINDTDPNKWIDLVDSSWSGAIPATVIYKNNSKMFFHEGELSFGTLDSIITVIQNKK